VKTWLKASCTWLRGSAMPPVRTLPCSYHGTGVIVRRSVCSERRSVRVHTTWRGCLASHPALHSSSRERLALSCLTLHMAEDTPPHASRFSSSFFHPHSTATLRVHAASRAHASQDGQAINGRNLCFLCFRLSALHFCDSTSVFAAPQAGATVSAPRCAPIPLFHLHAGTASTDDAAVQLQGHHRVRRS